MIHAGRKGRYRLAIALALSCWGVGCAWMGSSPPAKPPISARDAKGVPVGLVAGAKASDGQIIVGLNPGYTTDSLPGFRGQRAVVIGSLDFAMPIRMLRLPNGVSVDEAIAILKTSPAVGLIEANETLSTAPRPAVLIGQTSPIGGPNDPLFAEEWGFSDSSTQVRAIWKRHIDASRVVVAVIDTGIDYTHPDLSGRVLVGYNFKDGNDDIRDTDGHGTHVAGILGAAGNNGYGIAGVCWDCKLLAVKVMDGSGGTDFGAIAGIKYATDVGAKVINLSFTSDNPQRNPLFDLAIQYAVDHGALVVAAAGNQHGPVTAPANSPGVVAVSATSERNFEGLANFSNYGPQVYIAAPGENILSDYLNQGFRTLSGTSMAAPFISGAAAELLGEHPDWSLMQVETALAQSTDPLGMVGRNDQFGYGRIDFAKLP
jgi:subtilisin family serine protease